jgi:hypothetical protein
MIFAWNHAKIVRADHVPSRSIDLGELDEANLVLLQKGSQLCLVVDHAISLPCIEWAVNINISMKKLIEASKTRKFKRKLAEIEANVQDPVKKRISSSKLRHAMMLRKAARGAKIEPIQSSGEVNLDILRNTGKFDAAAQSSKMAGKSIHLATIADKLRDLHSTLRSKGDITPEEHRSLRSTIGKYRRILAANQPTKREGGGGEGLQMI